MNDYAVRYREGHSGSGECHDTTVAVTAYTSQDAAHQAMLDPERRSRANAPYAYCYVLAVAPYRESFQIDSDQRRVKAPYFRLV